MTATPPSLSSRRPLRFWGWGYADEDLSDAEVKLLSGMAAVLSDSGLTAVDPPQLGDFELPQPRIQLPDNLSDITSTFEYDRLVHTYGTSYPDMLRMCLRQVPNTPDAVAYPRNEQDIADLLDWCSDHDVAVVPYGGGTSVCGGVEADVGDAYQGAISLDLQRLNRVLEIDRTSRAARIEAGILGPELEQRLGEQGLTLRHFPQSFQFSSLGGWIATRAGGHYASLYTHIDDFVESTRSLSPRGVIETRRLPGSGAGPSPDRLIIGSEGTLGVITQAWMRLQDRPRFKATASAVFKDLPRAVATVRALSQSALFPSNCRLLDGAEAHLNGLGAQPVLVLGFESADHPVDAWMDRALELVRDGGGEVRAPKGQDLAGDWRQAFIRMPYFRNYLVPLGVLADTFESAVTWDQFEAFYNGVHERVGKVLSETTGAPSVLSCRFTHVYPDGPAPYFTFYGLGTASGDLHSALERWREVKRAANEAVAALGGTATHHHAVGRDHRSAYETESPPLFREALAAAKHTLDPAAVLNPGVLIDPKGRPRRPGGVLG